MLAATFIVMTSSRVRELMRVGRKVLLTRKPAFASARLFSSEKHVVDSTHFRETCSPHPLATEGNTMKASKAIFTVISKDEHGNIKTEVTIAVEKREHFLIQMFLALKLFVHCNEAT